MILLNCTSSDKIFLNAHRSVFPLATTFSIDFFEIQFYSRGGGHNINSDTYTWEQRVQLAEVCMCMYIMW